MELIAASDMNNFLLAARLGGQKLLGVEGFLLSGKVAIPDMDAIADFSKSATNPQIDTIEEAMRFVEFTASKGLFYELTYL
jgi:hypothetical protein